MSENQKTPLAPEAEQKIETPLEEGAQPETDSPSAPGWIFPWLLLLSLLLTGGYFFLHPGPFSPGGLYHTPAIGLMLSQFLLLGAGIFAGKKAGRLRFRGNSGGIFLFICAAGLGLSFGLFASDELRMLNLPVVLMLTVQSLFALNGCNARSSLSGSGLWEGFRRFFSSLFISWRQLFDSLGFSRYRPRKKISGLAAGLLLGLAAALIALGLLGRADQIFGEMTKGWADSWLTAIGHINGGTVMKLLLTILLGMLLFSFLYSLTRSPKAMNDPAPRALPPLVFEVALVLLSLIYALFAFVQFRYLFFSVTPLPKADYASYARSGFFQLVLLALLTLMLIVPALHFCRESKAVRALCGVLSCLTMIIDASAFFRMRLYIEGFGLSLLRVITLWGMGMILLALIATLLRSIRPAWQLTPILLSIVLASWVMLSLSNINLHIARYNVRAWNAKTLEQLDTQYLIQLGPGAAPALTEIEDEEMRQETMQAAKKQCERDCPSFYDWNFNYYSVSPAKNLPEEMLPESRNDASFTVIP